MAGRQFGIEDLVKFLRGETEGSVGDRKFGDRGNETEELDGVKF